MPPGRNAKGQFTAGGSLGALFVSLGLDSSQFEKAIKDAQASVKELGEFFDSFGKKIDRTVTTSFKAATAAVAGFAAASTVLGANFEQAIAKVGAIADARGNELNALSDQARKIGRETAFTATEAATAMNDLAQAGLGVKDIIAASEAAVLLAGATGSELEQSTALLAATLSQFRLSATDTARVADVFSKAMNSTLFDMNSLTEAMKYAGTVGAGLGYTLEETTAAVAMFRNLGLEGSLAGTAFKMAMAGAAHETEHGASTLKKYGLTYKDINPELHDFADIMERIGKAGMTTTDAMEIFGSRAGANVASIAAQFRDGSTTFYDTLADLKTSAGSTEETYKKMMDTVSGQFRIAASAVEELMLVVFDQYKGPLKELLVELGNTITYVARVFSGRTAYMKSGLAELFEGWADWLRENKQLIAVWFTTIVNVSTGIVRELSAVLPLLASGAAIMATIFVANKVYAFAAAVMSGVRAVQALAVAFSEAAAAGTVASGGLLPIAAAITAAVLTIGSFVVAMGKAKDAAQRLADAERKVEESARKMTQAYVDHYAEVLPAQQARIRAIMAERAATGELTVEEQRRLEALLELDAAGAAEKVMKGELIDLNGELLSIETLIEEKGNEGVALAKARAAEFQKTADIQKANADALQKKIDRYNLAIAEGTTNQLAQNLSLGRYGGTIEETIAKQRLAADEAKKWGDAAKALQDRTTNAIAKITQEAMSEVQTAHADAMSNVEVASDDAIKKAQQAAAEHAITASGLAAAVANAERGYEALKKAVEETEEPLKNVQKTLEAIYQAFRDQKMFDLKTEVLNNEVEELRKQWDLTIDLGVNGFKQLWGSISNGAIGLWQSLGNGARGAWEGITGTARSVLEGNLRITFSNLKLEGDLLWSAFKEKAKDAAKAIGSAFTGMIGTLTGGFGSFFSAGGAFDLPGLFKDSAVDTGNKQKDALLQKRKSKAAVKEAIETQVAFLKGFADALPGMLSMLIKSLPELFDAIVKAVPQIITAVLTHLPELITALIDGLVEMLAHSGEIVAAILTNLPDIVAAIIAKLPQIAGALIDALWDGVKEIGAFLKDLIIEAVSLGFAKTSLDKKDKKGLGAGLKEFFTLGFANTGFDKKPPKEKNKDKGGAWSYSGYDFVPATMRVTVHPGDVISNPSRRPSRATDGINPPYPPPPVSSSGSRSSTEIAVVIGEQIVDTVCVSAIDNGHAPELSKRLRRASGRVRGYNAGRLTKWGG